VEPGTKGVVEATCRPQRPGCARALTRRFFGRRSISSRSGTTRALEAATRRSSGRLKRRSWSRGSRRISSPGARPPRRCTRRSTRARSAPCSSTWPWSRRTPARHCRCMPPPCLILYQHLPSLRLLSANAEMHHHTHMQTHTLPLAGRAGAARPRGGGAAHGGGRGSRHAGCPLPAPLRCPTASPACTSPRRSRRMRLPLLAASPPSACCSAPARVFVRRRRSMSRTARPTSSASRRRGCARTPPPAARARARAAAPA
jgi:hypothetical protein